VAQRHRDIHRGGNVAQPRTTLDKMNSLAPAASPVRRYRAIVLEIEVAREMRPAIR
jgi:hypothetical protein